MKPILEKISFELPTALRTLKYRQRCFNMPWHFHPEYELTLITEGYGKRFIGDHVEPFAAGDLVFIGSGVPHVWINDSKFHEPDTTLNVGALVVQFSAALLNTEMLSMHEFTNIRRLLQKSARGIKILLPARDEVANRLEAMHNTQGIRRFSILMETLDYIEHKNNYHLLSATANSYPSTPDTNEKLQRVTRYLVNNYHRPLSLEEIAKEANMNVSAFCRFFKTHTRKTFSQYLNDLRVGYACKLLQDENLSISQICYECGFNNLSYFNRQFKRVTRQTPREYRSAFRFQ